MRPASPGIRRTPEATRQRRPAALRRPTPLDEGPAPLVAPGAGPAADLLAWFASDGPDQRYAREQYSRLAVTLHERQRESGLQVVMVASAAPREGKTLTVANLSLTLSESCDRRVLVIDGDLRRPSVHQIFGVPNRSGVREALSLRGPLPLVRATERLSLLTSGQGGGDPMRTLTSDEMLQVVERARADFDWVLIDTPPIGLLADARVLAAMADGVLLVARAGRTPYPLIQRAVDALGQERLIGVVLNGATETSSEYGYADYAYGDVRG